MNDFQRARSDEAKRARETAILDAARALGARDQIRRVTLTDIADEVGMHKSALLRYFETREQIFLQLTAEGWREWSAAVRSGLTAIPVQAASPTAEAVASVFAGTLAARPLFCDLLAQAALTLERNVSLEAVRAFKLVTHEEIDAMLSAVRPVVPELPERDGRDLIAAAVSLAGALYQFATPGEELAALYRSDPRLGHAIVDLEPRLTRMLADLLTGMLARGV